MSSMKKEKREQKLTGSGRDDERERIPNKDAEHADISLSDAITSTELFIILEDRVLSLMRHLSHTMLITILRLHILLTISVDLQFTLDLINLNIGGQYNGKESCYIW